MDRRAVGVGEEAGVAVIVKPFERKFAPMDRLTAVDAGVVHKRGGVRTAVASVIRTPIRLV